MIEKILVMIKFVYLHLLYIYVHMKLNTWIDMKNAKANKRNDEEDSGGKWNNIHDDIFIIVFYIFRYWN